MTRDDRFITCDVWNAPIVDITEEDFARALSSMLAEKDPRSILVQAEVELAQRLLAPLAAGEH